MHLVSADQAVSLIRDEDTILIGGSGRGHAVSEALIAAFENLFLERGEPRKITLLHPVGLGDMSTQGVGRLAHPKSVKRIITGALVNTPEIAELAR